MRAASSQARILPSHSFHCCTGAFVSLLHFCIRCVVALVASAAPGGESQRVSELENCAFPHILLEETLEGNLKDIFDQIHVSAP